jgi:hypothetical protein
LAEANGNDKKFIAVPFMGRARIDEALKALAK